jgi:hypothetical protein
MVFVIDPEIGDRATRSEAVNRARGRGVTLPTFSQRADPMQIPPENLRQVERHGRGRFIRRQFVAHALV